SRGGRVHVQHRDDLGDRATPLSGTQLEASIEVTSLSDAFEVVVYREITEIRVEGLKPRR
ncbi:hypothetical protein RCF19_32230, partial [Rhodococcus qingshengii]